MRIDDIKTFLVANLATYIAALSTVDVPLAAIPATSIFTREVHEVVGKVSLSLDDDDEQIEQITLNTREVTLPVMVVVQVAGATMSVLAAQAIDYGQAILNCLKAYPDFSRVVGRSNWDGVEANPNIKATKLDLEFTYTEAI